MRTRRLARLGSLDDAVEYEPAVADPAGGEFRACGVAVLVDVVGAEHGPAAADAEELLDDLGAIVAEVARGLDGVQHRGHRLVAEDRIRRGRTAIAGGERPEEALARARIHLWRKLRGRDLHGVLSAAEGVRERAPGELVRSEE